MTFVLVADLDVLGVRKSTSIFGSLFFIGVPEKASSLPVSSGRDISLTAIAQGRALVVVSLV